jgi:RNA polymerase sigma factor (sigma-70 family)
MDDQSQAYEEIIGPIEDRMLRSIWRITRDAYDAEDAMQNALVMLWKRWNRVRRHASPQALVLRICVDAALDVARRRVRDRRNIESNDPASHPAEGSRLPLEELANAELRREVLAAIGRLSRRQAVTVMLRAFEELPYNQIAAALGCTEATARKHFERACAQLRLALARHQPNVSIGGSHDRSRRQPT